MSWWGTGNKVEHTIYRPEPEVLQEYLNLTNEINDIKAGDYIKLKNKRYLPDVYLDFKKSNIKSTAEDVYGYVLEREMTKDSEYKSLGNNCDLKVANIINGEIHIVRVDSRLFEHNRNEFKLLPPKLVEFAEDNPATDLKPGILVKPRKNVGSVVEPLISPMIVIHVTKEKINLAGITNNSPRIIEKSVDPSLLALYN